MFRGIAYVPGVEIVAVSDALGCAGFRCNGIIKAVQFACGSFFDRLFEHLRNQKSGICRHRSGGLFFMFVNQVSVRVYNFFYKSVLFVYSAVCKRHIC